MMFSYLLKSNHCHLARSLLSGQAYEPQSLGFGTFARVPLLGHFLQQLSLGDHSPWFLHLFLSGLHLWCSTGCIGVFKESSILSPPGSTLVGGFVGAWTTSSWCWNSASREVCPVQGRLMHTGDQTLDIVDSVTVQLAGLEISITARRLPGSVPVSIGAASSTPTTPGHLTGVPGGAPTFPLTLGRAALAARSAAELRALELPFLDYLRPRLRGASPEWTPQARLARAFAAGFAAALRLEGETHSHSSLATSFRNSFYIALRSPRHPEGFWTPNYAFYIAEVGPGSPASDFHHTSVSHAFPTRSEAEAYLIGAQRPWPPSLQL